MDTRLGHAGRPLDSGSYTDLNRLSQLKVGKDRDGAENVRKVAQEFESLFLNEMLKSMRSANEVLAKDNPFNSQASKQYQDMYDQQLSVSLSKEGGGIGLADVLVRQLSPHKDAASRPNPFAQVASTVPADAASKPQADLTRRDDSRLINQRRLALPGKLGDRQLANVAATNPPPLGDARPLARQDWRPAQAFAAPKERPLSIDGREATTLAASGRTQFDSPEEFIATMLPMAEKAAQRLGVEPRFLVAQAALETGWGKSMIRQRDGSNSHNLFGIKATGWGGEAARVRTTEYIDGRMTRQMADFRAYGSFEQSFNDYVSLLQNNSRYRSALQAAGGPGNSERFVQELQKAGYATDPQYARKVNQIARKMQTYQTIADASPAPTMRTRG